MLLLSYITSPIFIHTKNNAAIPSYSGGRLGDNLLAVAHTLYFCMKNNWEMLYVPFTYSNQLVLDTATKKYSPQRAKQFKKKQPFCPQHKSVFLNKLLTNTLMVIPYFSERMTSSSSFVTDWNDPFFKAELRRLLAPKKSLSLITPPKDKFSIAVHVRRGGNYEVNLFSNNSQYHRNKAPLDQFYANQIKKIAALTNHSPIYAFIFTDDENPKRVTETIKLMVNLACVEFDYRRKNNHHNTNVLEDCYSMIHFNSLIRPESHLSFMAEKLGDHEIIISPGQFLNGSHVQEGVIKLKNEKELQK